MCIIIDKTGNCTVANDESWNLLWWEKKKEKTKHENSLIVQRYQHEIWKWPPFPSFFLFFFIRKKKNVFFFLIQLMFPHEISVVYGKKSKHIEPLNNGNSLQWFFFCFSSIFFFSFFKKQYSQKLCVCKSWKCAHFLVPIWLCYWLPFFFCCSPVNCIITSLYANDIKWTKREKRRWNEIKSKAINKRIQRNKHLYCTHDRSARRKTDKMKKWKEICLRTKRRKNDDDDDFVFETSIFNDLHFDLDGPKVNGCKHNIIIFGFCFFFFFC